MSEVRETKKSKLLAFRVTDEEYAQIERMALVVGEDLNNWCRNIIVAQASEGSGLTKTQRLLYEEIARVRYLVGNGFRLLLSSNEASAEESHSTGGSEVREDSRRPSFKTTVMVTARPTSVACRSELTEAKCM